MIYSEIYDLKQYINSECKVKTVIGMPDTDPNEYPVVQIRIVEDFVNFRSNEKTTTFDLPLDLHIVTAEGREDKALEVLERLILKINQFNAYKGHQLEGPGTPAYVEETKTFEISLLYTLKLIIQDT